MIYPDLTAILSDFWKWDKEVQHKYLTQAYKIMTENQRIIYKGIEYHNIEDLKVDLLAECE